MSGKDGLFSILFATSHQLRNTHTMTTTQHVLVSKTEYEELKSKNRELQAQLEQMQTIFNSLNEGIVATSTAGDFLLANPTAQSIVSMGKTEDSPDEWSEHYGTFYPDKVTPVPSEELPLMQARQGKVTDNVELFIRNEGNPHGVFISVSGRPLYDVSGELIGGVILMRDITELRAVQAQLEQSVSSHQDQSRLLDAIFNSIGDAVIVVDENGKYVMFNRRADEMGGRKLRGKHIKDSPEQVGLFQLDGETAFPVDELPLTRALLGESTDNIELLMRNELLPQDIYVDVAGRSILDSNGKVTGAVSVVRDITQLKKTEEQLKTSITKLRNQNQFIEAVFNCISDGVAVADENGTFTMFNPSAELLTGNVAHDIHYDKWSDKYGLFYMDKETEFPTDKLPLVRAIRGESTDNVEMFIRNPSIPEGAYLNVSGRPLRYGNGEQQGGVVVFHDITQRVLAAERLTQAFTEGRLEVVETILHNIGNAINSVAVGVDTVYEQLANNELSSRLTALANALEAHQEDLGDYITNHPQGQRVVPFIQALASDLSEVDHELRETTQRVREKTSHIVDIIRTQKSHGSAQDMRKDINLAEAFSSAVKVLQESIKSRNIGIEVDCDGALEEIRIQESQFHQMIVNLVKNSIEAIDEFEELNEAPFIRVRAESDADWLRIDVTDNGIGLDTEQSREIFSAGYTTKQKGTGLGLHSSANFVIAAGGKISASSDGYRKGTTIHIVFPCSRISPPSLRDG